jgi:uncharacterized membrane protein
MLHPMQGLQTHLRNKFLAGIVAAAPIVVLVLGILWIEEHTRPLAEWIGYPYPGLGIVLALAGVYLLGVVVTSLFGRVILGGFDHVLRRVPGLKLLYQAWKDVLIVSTGKKDIYSQVVLVPMPEGAGVQLGFTNGEETPAGLCVFLPNAPNPITGRLLLVPKGNCRFVDMPMEEAFKFLLSTGNYVPGMADAPRPTTRE